MIVVWFRNINGENEEKRRKLKEKETKLIERENRPKPNHLVAQPLSLPSIATIYAHPLSKTSPV
jgi:hypothetical protein